MDKKTKKIEEMANDFKDVIENFTETLTSLMEKITSYLDTTNKLTMLGSLSNYPQETQKFRNDLQKYGLGVFLWFEKEFPNIFIIFNQVGFLPSVIKIKDIRKCIDEYDHFINMVKQKHTIITELEISETYEKFFNKTINPIKILIRKSHLWRKIDENTSIYIDIFFKTLPALELYLEILTKIVKIEMARYRVQKGRRKGKYLFKLTERTYQRINKEFNTKCPKKIIKEIQELGEYNKNITTDLDYIKEHKTEDFYNLLELSKDLHEFHIDLVKFILRLWHIYENGDRNFANNYKIDYQFSKINSLVNYYLNQKLIQYCPNLSRILTGFFLPFEKYRHIESHTTPDLKLSNDENYVLIPQKGKKYILKVNISEFQKSIRTYQSFIEALRIYR